MQNGYFKLVKAPGGYGIRFYPPEDGGEEVRLSEVLSYLDTAGILYDAEQIKKYVLDSEGGICFLGRKDCPALNETYKLEISSDNMTAVARFYPPSDTGARITFDDFFSDLRVKNIVAGIQMDVLQDFFQSPGVYCTNLVVAKGREPRQGHDARIEYFFNTDVHVQPAVREDGSVDFFHLNVINHCKKGDMLARIIPEDPGEQGQNIMGVRLAPKNVKKAVLKFSNHIELSEDKSAIYSMVNGHVTLVDDKVFVSDVYEVENVDISTGNVEFEGSVQVNGNVASNYVVVAKGNVIINGVVEGAQVIAGGNIIIARGMNGMGKGMLQAGGNVVAKYIESATVKAEGYVETGSILHSEVSAGTEVTVSGKRGFITGGHVQAGNRVNVKNLGATMGAPTIIEVGVNAEIKAEYIQMQKEVMEAVKVIKNTQPVLVNFSEKRAKGMRFTPEQLKYIRETAKVLEEKKEELAVKNNKMQKLQLAIDSQRRADVAVTGVAYPGTTIIIGDVSMILQSEYRYCKFEKVDGDVKMVPM